MELEALMDILQNGEQDAIQQALLDFNKEYAQCFFFNAEARERRKRMGELVMKLLGRELQPSCRLAGLETVRILSRDKQALAPFSGRGGMGTLARLAGLEEDGERRPPDAEVACEALQCLCNTVYNSPAAREAAEQLRLLRGLAAHLKRGARDRPGAGTGPEAGLPDPRFYELRLMFLLTALSVDARLQLGRQLRGLALLTATLEAALGLGPGAGDGEAVVVMMRPLRRHDTERAMEVLKILFNITFDTNRRQVDEEEAALYRHLAVVLRHCLLTHTESKERTQEFHGHTVNLLVNLPLACLDVLLTPRVEPGSVEYMGLNMDAVAILLDFLDKRLDRGLKLRETLTPVLSLLTESARFHRETRKFLRSRVLPPLRDVRNRPEVGETLRNKLVRLMTHINTDVKHCAADFLFVLCKENVSRFVKYTGYGNAAGLLAARGLLGGGRGGGEYSEEEDTDTEEYKEAKANINPVTGRVEEKLPDPMEGMTEEQKEYEAMKLISMFDKLSREQIIQPMVVGCDGKLTPIDETVQQMAEQISLNSDSDID
ncbi:LOW QUALITY PROTEIN: synembryn-A-like [Leucoraja erinacea]|uniref:LOW QUALITY PROTEIN: synembryn-A-like n=1 Tax=Leucoraja erinaceus TaxID=7782 RepID=UPI002453AF89|nr:LOW QUALITY PROTEIN: synembryn-A-like [Leucoraja erinacea]